jgi:hypothetical protein
VLRQLARTRQRAHLNIEQLRVGRERLLAAYQVAKATIDQATAELDRSSPEAKALAERLAGRIGDDEARTLQELEAEFELERLEDLRVLSDEDPAARVPARPAEPEADAEPVAEIEAPTEAPTAKVFDMEAAEEEAEVEAEVQARADEADEAVEPDEDEVIDLTDAVTEVAGAEDHAPAS